MRWDRPSEKMLLLDLISGAERAGHTGSASEHKGSTSGHCKGNGRIKRAGWKKKPGPGAWHGESCQLPKRLFRASFPEKLGFAGHQGLCAPMVVLDRAHFCISVNTGLFSRNPSDPQFSATTAAACGYCIDADKGRATKAVGLMLHNKAWVSLFLKARGISELFQI